MKKQTKHEKIIALYKEGMKPKDIIKKLKCGTSTVYKAISEYKKTLGKIVFIEETIIKNETLLTKIKRFLFGE